MGCKVRRSCRRRPVRKAWRSTWWPFPPSSTWRASGALAAFVVIEHSEHFRFPGRLASPHRYCRLPMPPGIVAAGHHVQPLVQLLDGGINALLINERQRAHGVRGCEKMSIAFFNMSSSCARRLVAARRARKSTASMGVGWQRQMGRFLPVIEPFGIDIQGAGSGQHRAAFAGQAQGFDPEDRIITRPFRRRSFFHGFGRLTPNSLPFYPTTSHLTRGWAAPRMAITKEAVAVHKPLFSQG